MFPRLGLFVVTCLDPRVDPAHFLGLSLGDAVVVRNVGGRVTPEVINDIAFIGQIAENVLPDGPLFEVAAIPHAVRKRSACRRHVSSPLRRAHRRRRDDPAGHAILDPAATVRRDVDASARLARSRSAWPYPGISTRWSPVGGTVCPHEQGARTSADTRRREVIAIFEELATFAYSNRRRVLFVAVIGTAIAGVFGAGVSKHLSPYGADDPPRRASRRRIASRPRPAARSIPASIALISTLTCAAAPPDSESRTSRRSSRRSPTWRAFRLLHHARPRDGARDGRSTYVVAYFKACRTCRFQRRQADREPLLLPARRQAGRRRDRQRPGEYASRQRLGPRRAARVPLIFLLSLIFFRSVVASLLPPLLGGLAISARSSSCGSSPRSRTCRCSR